MVDPRKEADQLAEIEARKDEEALTREPLEQELMEEGASEVGEDIADADAVRPRGANERPA